jgi:hypothetical protein
MAKKGKGFGRKKKPKLTFFSTFHGPEKFVGAGLVIKNPYEKGGTQRHAARPSKV